ncbi:MAG: ribonuclease III [Acidimicrobiia bacterium]|nr:ribonuclease III [Acidimicrobiia bacterium]
MIRLGDLESALGYRFRQPGHLIEALCHRSWAADYGGASNERLEFLGDTILQMVVTNFIYEEYPRFAEGKMAQLRSSVVNKKVLYLIAQEFDLGVYLSLGAGEEATGGREKTSILADAMEAVIGAVYLDGGLTAADELIMERWEERIRAEAREPGRRDYKSRLNVALGQEAGRVRYEVTFSGPDHDRLYTAWAFLGDQELGKGSGGSKREAEQQAASQSIDLIA